MPALSPTYCAAGGVALVFTAVLVIKSRLNAKKRRAHKPAPQTSVQPRPFDGSAPGNGAPVFVGVRVLELSTVLATPSVSRMMGDLGAEVIKIETPNGDELRRVLLPFEKGRTSSTNFDAINQSKIGIQLDLKDPFDFAEIKKLLKGADVFLTNVRADALERLGLDRETIQKEFPNLIYAHLTAWGLQGRDCSLPGYDVGAFWASTGLAQSMQDPQLYGFYPGGFGDLTTGGGLLGGIALALASRAQGGRGQHVHTSLAGTGLWCVAPKLCTISTATANDSVHTYAKPQPDKPTYQVYMTNDQKFVMLCDQRPSNSTLESVETCLGCKPGSIVSAAGTAGYEALRDAIAGMSLDDATARLEKSGVEFIHPLGVSDTLRPDAATKQLFENSGTWTDPMGIDDLPNILTIPLDVHCSDMHGPNRPAPKKGEHNDHIAKHGWSDRHVKAEFPDGNKPPTSSLRGKTVVEISHPGHGVAAAGAAQQLATTGAQVVFIEPVAGDPLRQDDPDLFRQLNHGKNNRALDIFETTPNSSDVAALHAELAKAAVLVTNLPMSQLKRIGLDPRTAKKQFPSLVFCLITPYGIDGPEGTRGDLASWWGRSALCGIISGGPPSMPPNLPRHLGEQIAAIFAFAAASTGVFHHARSGEGSLVEVNLHRIGMWVSGVLWTFYNRDPEMAKVFMIQRDLAPMLHFIPTYNCFQAADDSWIQLLGLDLPRHFANTTRCLGVKARMYPGVLKTILLKVLPNRKEKNILRKLLPVFEHINSTFRDGMRRVSYSDFKALALKNNVWFCHSRTPDQAALAPHFYEMGSLLRVAGTDKLVVAPPVTIESEPAPSVKPVASQ